MVKIHQFTQVTHQISSFLPKQTFAEKTLYIARLPSRFVGDLLSSQGLMCRQESKESLSSDHSGSGPSGDSDDQWLSQVLFFYIFMQQYKEINPHN